jgi:hypothetical protein
VSCDRGGELIQGDPKGSSPTVLSKNRDLKIIERRYLRKRSNKTGKRFLFFSLSFLFLSHYSIMGQTLSEPVTEKHTTQGKDGRVMYGASGMQGWRFSKYNAAVWRDRMVGDV